MSGRGPLVVGNWKMNPAGAELAAAIRQRVAALPAGTRIVLCPAFPYLAPVGGALAGSRIGLGAQDLHWEAKGAMTGAVSAGMLIEAGCRHVIVAHSERRRLFGETDASARAKVQAALAAGLTPILCVGESASEREAGYALRRVQAQTQAAFAPGAVVAYEPLWAIGSGRAASPEDARLAAAAIREAAGAEVAVLYGGSVNPANCASFFAVTDGALVGGASLDAEAFAAICAAAASAPGAGPPPDGPHDPAARA